MNVFRTVHATHIEATSAEQAENILIENNGISKEEYFNSLDAASARYAEIKGSLSSPVDLGFHGGKNLFWFEGAFLEAGYNCDEEADLSDAFQSAANWKIIEVSVCR